MWKIIFTKGFPVKQTERTWWITSWPSIWYLVSQEYPITVCSQCQTWMTVCSQCQTWMFFLIWILVINLLLFYIMQILFLLFLTRYYANSFYMVWISCMQNIISFHISLTGHVKNLFYFIFWNQKLILTLNIT